MLNPLTFALLFVLNVVLVAGQEASRWCDGLSGFCLWRFHEETFDMGWGYIFPPLGKDEFIGFFTAPIRTGWMGASLGGPMRNNPLLVTWVDGNIPRISVRSTPSFSPPQPVSNGFKVTVLGTSGANATHQRIIFRCENCTTWTGGVGGINLTGEHYFGFATHAAIKPLNPENPASGLYQHTEAGLHQFNTVDARAGNYDVILAQLRNAPPLEPGTPTSTSVSPTPTEAALCTGAPNSIYPLNVAAGWKATAVLSRLSSPRGLVVDSKGNLVILQREIGITGHEVDAIGCVKSSKVIIANPEFNHGLDVVGNKLYVSAPDVAWEWDYDPNTMTVSNQRVLVKEMFNPGHITRTIHVSRKYPNFISISVGSDGNLDIPSIDPALGRSQVRVFDMDRLPAGGADYNSSYGKVFGYGMRNNVGIAEDRNGNVYTVENSLDDAHRVIDGVLRDIHDDNPAEKVFILGNPNKPDEGLFGGYPQCFSVWYPEDITDVALQPGDWFVQDPRGNYTESWCNANAIKPLLILPPHSAPLDLKFGVRPDDTNLYVPLHGSSARSTTLGYKIVVVPGRYTATGEWLPTANLAGTKSSTTDLFFNTHENQCRLGCFRPVAMAFSANGDNLYVSSDTSGEVFLLKAPPIGPIVSTTTGPVIPTTTIPTIPSSTSSSPQATQSLYGQCGGNTWSGPTLCPAGVLCKLINQYFSQCLYA